MSPYHRICLFIILVYYSFPFSLNGQNISSKDLKGQWTIVDTAYSKHGQTMTIDFRDSNFMIMRDRGVLMGVDIYRLIKRNELQYILILEAEFVESPSELINYDSLQLRKISLNADTLTIENITSPAHFTPPIKNRFVRSKK